MRDFDVYREREGGRNETITFQSPVSDHTIWEDDIKEGIVSVPVSPSR